MKIVYKDTFVFRLEKQIKYITIDNPTAARRFEKDLIEKLRQFHLTP
jgi:hypothetical protein